MKTMIFLQGRMNSHYYDLSVKLIVLPHSLLVYHGVLISVWDPNKILVRVHIQRLCEFASLKSQFHELDVNT